MSSFTPFESFTLNKLKIQPIRANGAGKAGKTIYIDTEKGESGLFITPKDMRLQWAIRPGMDGEIRPHERLNLTLEIKEDMDKFEKKAEELDQLLMEHIFKNKKEILANKAKDVDSIHSLKLMYKRLLKDGGENKDGKKYCKSLTLKVDGWASFIESCVFSEYEDKNGGGKRKIVKDCVWKPRLITESGGNGPTERETVFNLFVGVNPLTGRDRYTQKVPLTDETGEIVKDASGKIVFEWVGPKHAKPNSLVTAVFKIPKMYVTETMGPTPQVCEVFVKPISSKAKETLENCDVVEDVDPLELIKAMNGDVGTEVAVTSEIPEATIPESVAPPPAEAASPPPPPKKSKKTVELSDF